MNKKFVYQVGNNTKVSVIHIRATNMILLIQLQQLAPTVDRHLNCSNLKYKLSYMCRYE